ncbi:TetR/AcrR family transcriptional regulator [Pseudolysobacter antarcticus]|uniref:TetR/AcrR family transcriptional regulator n=1 Tax=Pseudolysobacter antarcticus TaxID=2511995 RepID=A0A411HPU9_9GAMM|nr:TetR/AcrR family transcriptional regulator [Pseudolysobacter antarcticus]QBB72505.1 TetR/AcrR family transcriptional regulator [Pseudolysobacter antarcticus]
MTTKPVQNPLDVRERILQCASALFYRQGVRAVGVDLVVEHAGVAKTSLYRHFRTKDDLVVAFLEREDIDFWATWDDVAAKYSDDPADELAAHMRWIGERLSRSNYRGCPQINVAAEFAEQEHPARQVARAHMHGLRSRLAAIARRLDVAHPDILAAQLALLVNGAFVSSELLATDDATRILLTSTHALVEAARAAVVPKA